MPPPAAKPPSASPLFANFEPEAIERTALLLEGDQIEIGAATEELKRLKPIMSRNELMDAILEGSDLRAMGPAVQQVLALTRSASSSIDAIAKAIKQDQALSLKVLKVANSPLFAHGERVENVQKAVTRIGISQIQTTVMSLSVVDQFSAASLAGRIKTEWFWEHSIACGLIASRIARARGCKNRRDRLDVHGRPSARRRPHAVR